MKAWIRFPNCAEPVDGEMYAWTAKAVEVTWQDGPVKPATSGDGPSGGGLMTPVVPVLRF